jgi:hypothetical protein
VPATLRSGKFKKFNPQLVGYYRHVVRAEKTADNEVTFTFDV